MSLRIGIPRALQFFQDYPFWRTFFDDLGAEVVVSPPTNREIVTAGAQVVADMSCLPIKVYAGHVAWLRDNGNVDFVFAPAIWSVDHEAFHCARLKALPDILKATLPNCPPLLDIEINPHWRHISSSKAFRRLGRQFTWNPLKIESAWANARKVAEHFRALLYNEQLTYLEALARLYGPEWLPAEYAVAVPDPTLTIAVVGHPYCLYDDYINHGLLLRLRKLGARLLTSEMVSPDEARAGIAQTTGKTNWFYENWMSGAAGHYLRQPQVDGLIAVLTFACGPDSTMVETITRRAHALQRSCMRLVLDEHGSATGMVTRLEAFVDMLTRQKQTTNQAPSAPFRVLPRPVARPTPPAVLCHRQTPVVGFPRMGTTYVPIKSLLRGIGAPLELGPPMSKQTTALGGKYAPEFICTPYKNLLGNMLEMLEAGASTLIYVDGVDLCRNSLYAQMMRDVLHDLGYQFTLTTFSEVFEGGGVFALPKFLRRFAPNVSNRDVIREIYLALTKMMVLDDIERRVQYFRPREITPGTVDKVWQEGITRIDDVTTLDALRRTKADVLQKLNRTPIDPTLRPVKIAVMGEIYAVLDPFFNMDMERELGRIGAEAHRPLMMSNWLRGTMILGALGLSHTAEIERAARPYLRGDISGEGWAIIGETVLHAQKGFDGVILLLPFTCEPIVAALSILPQVSRDYHIPIMPFIFDEQSGQAGMKTRMEAFVDLLYRRRVVNESARQAAPVAEWPATDALCQTCPIVATCSRTEEVGRPTDCNLARRGH